MDIRRTLLWIIFSFSLLMLWNNWQIHNGKPSVFGTVAETENSSTANNSDNGESDSIPSAPESSSNSLASASEISQASDDEIKSELITVNSKLLDLTFDTTGAQIVKAQINDYAAPSDPDNRMVLFQKDDEHIYVAQTGAVGAAAGKSFPTHLSPFKLVSNTQQGEEQVIVFESTVDSVRLVKEFTINESSYVVNVRHEIHNLSDEPINPALYFQLTRDDSDPKETSTFYKTFTGPTIYSEQEKFQKITFSDIKKQKAKYLESTDNGWIGMVQHYFASAWVPTQGVERKNEVLSLGKGQYAVRTILSPESVAANEMIVVDSALWVGPQDQKAMSELAPGLELVVDYGWLTIIAKPLFMLMTFLHSFISNWGWTIVVLTLLIKAVFYPLSAASYRSMAKMKQVGPRLKSLREQFGDDKAKLNAAMMEMYRTEKINPLGGCLPMLIQIPVFIALYWVLLGSVEMRGAPWVLWIQDLAARDPYFILPIFMMATMFLQIKLNPTPPDPMQAKVMMAMPLVFGAMMFFFPAGLVLYWCVNNAVSIIQQRYIMNKLDKEVAAASR